MNSWNEPPGQELDPVAYATATDGFARVFCTHRAVERYRALQVTRRGRSERSLPFGYQLHGIDLTWEVSLPPKTLAQSAKVTRLMRSLGVAGDVVLMVLPKDARSASLADAVDWALTYGDAAVFAPSAGVALVSPEWVNHSVLLKRTNRQS